MLSDLVHYRNQLQEFNAQLLRDHAHNELKTVLDLVINTPLPTTSDNQVQVGYDSMMIAVAAFDYGVQQVIENINLAIAEVGAGHLKQTMALFEQRRAATKDFGILDRTITLSDEDKNVISTRISLRSDWHYPGLIIRPGRETWADQMVALDPLYIVDEDIEWLSPIQSRYSEEYNRRVLYTVIETYTDTEYLGVVPNNQIGFILAYNYFNFKPFEIVCRYLKECFEKLRPGGVIGFTINDCDRVGGVKLNENNFASYTPAGTILDYAKTLGYNIVLQHKLDAANTWLELAKPGELTSIRGGQSLAKIIA